MSDRFGDGEFDEIARVNLHCWNRQVERGFEYTKPWLNLDVDVLRDFTEGRLEHLPRPWIYIYPREALLDLTGKRVLCLASGGGQQSAVLSLLGAEVTVFDLCEAQLDGDRQAAAHYGYGIETVQGDMRDLSVLTPDSFDLVYQAISLVFVPDLLTVYREVVRVLKPGGLYRSGHGNPGTILIDPESWTGRGYVAHAPHERGLIDDPEDREFRHTLAEIHGGLIKAGLEIRGVWEDPRHLHHDAEAEPGSYEHMLGVVPKYFAILARLNG
ncbi:MAG: class I SAM-dependent methyltransferase [bacterium]|nr:class I SAM-dependent methyltransferase [bacterium]